MYLLCSHKFHKIENYFIFEMLKEKIFGQFSKNYRTYPKNCHLSKIWGGGPGCEIRDPEKTYPGFRGQKGPGSGSATLDGPQK
jgi:hypothetical protein